MKLSIAWFSVNDFEQSKKFYANVLGLKKSFEAPGWAEFNSGGHDEAAVGIKNVTVNEPQFLGHFPGNPVFPGVLLIEGMAQTAGAICVLSQMGGDHPKHVYFLTIDKAKFRKPVVPGDTIEYHVKKIARKKNMWWFRGEAKVAGQTVAEAEVGAMVA